MKHLAVVGVVLALGACATTLNTPHATLERSETDAEILYQGVVAALDADLSAGKLSKANHDTDKLIAWDDLQAVRSSYNAGQDLTSAVTKLQADLVAAKGVN